MSFTMAFNKKDYLAWIATQIEEDEVVLVTAHHNQIDYTKKTDTCNVKFQFPIFGFKNMNVVSDMANSKKVATMISSRDIFQRGLLDVVDGKEKEFIDHSPIRSKPTHARPQ